ncbi:MAG: glutamine-hydrolyzing carbamoyl-phosphate synthase small subunit [Gammaproteobacteria bacterium]|nr:glutamine-hydrolyzing carbamoyl-phosphate synthase small subunit [Gammaproteobacteria bacterium]
MTRTALLALEDGSLFRGEAVGIDGSATGEVVFNTAMSGYQEILTDPSYHSQLVALTSPHVGNVGTNPEDEESARVQVSGLIVRDIPPRASSWRRRADLPEYLESNGVVAISGIDTRRLTVILREKGAQSGCIMAGRVDEAAALASAREFPGLQGMDLARAVTTDTVYEWRESEWGHDPADTGRRATGSRFRVVAYDFGVKRNILRILHTLGSELTVVPATTPARDVLALAPDGVFLSNGPGDPEPCDYAIESMRELLSARVPLFGICLGHQLLALACGAQTRKMKFGHHGANHPVQDLESGRVMISSQNHGFAVDESSLPEDLDATHRSLFDGSLQGIRHRRLPAFGFQGHPEASPGPHDVRPLFERFVSMMRERGKPDRA